VPDPVPITDALDSMMRSLRGTDRKEIGGVFGRWAEAVGADLARHVRPVKLDRQVLTVEVDDPAWATQVRFLVDSIVERLDAVAGVSVARVEVRVAGSR
jgi:predicted nucleic acid-binding Zn ribbon protein